MAHLVFQHLWFPSTTFFFCNGELVLGLGFGLVVSSRVRMPTRAKLPEERHVPCALQQATWNHSCGMSQHNAEVVPGPYQMSETLV